MPLGANATSPGAGSRAELSGCVGPVDRLDQGGKRLLSATRKPYAAMHIVPW
jgi:hypothetical protein